MKDEGASVVIWNASGDSTLGTRTSDYLKSQGINVVQLADIDYGPATKIEIFNGKPYTVNYLSQLMGVASANILNSYDPAAGTDIRVTWAGIGLRRIRCPDNRYLDLESESLPVKNTGSVFFTVGLSCRDSSLLTRFRMTISL